MRLSHLFELPPRGLPGAGFPSASTWKTLPRAEFQSSAKSDVFSGWLIDDASPVPKKTVPSGEVSTVPTVWDSSLGAPVAEKAGMPSTSVLSNARLVGLLTSLAR